MAKLGSLSGFANRIQIGIFRRIIIQLRETSLFIDDNINKSEEK